MEKQGCRDALSRITSTSRPPQPSCYEWREKFHEVDQVDDNSDEDLPLQWHPGGLASEVSITGVLTGSTERAAQVASTGQWPPEERHDYWANVIYRLMEHGGVAGRSAETVADLCRAAEQEHWSLYLAIRDRCGMATHPDQWAARSTVGASGPGRDRVPAARPLPPAPPRLVVNCNDGPDGDSPAANTAGGRQASRPPRLG